MVTLTRGASSREVETECVCVCVCVYVCVCVCVYVHLCKGMRDEGRQRSGWTWDEREEVKRGVSQSRMQNTVLQNNQ